MVAISKKSKNSKIAAKDAEVIVSVDIAAAEAVLEETWREELMAQLLELTPDAFERLCQPLLRESGFVEVKVTGRSGDGGIDGVSIVRLWRITWLSGICSNASAIKEAYLPPAFEIFVGQ